LVIAALSLGLAGMAWKAGQAETLAAQSELRMERALEVTQLLTEFFDSVNPSLEGPAAKVADMIARWESVLDDAHRSPLVTAGLHAALSSAYAGIGDTDAAVRHQRDALRLREQHGAEAWELAESQLALGDLLRTRGGSDLGDTRELLVDAAASNAAAHGPNHALTLGAEASVALFDWSYGDRTDVLANLHGLLQRMLELEPPGSSPLIRMRNALALTLLDAGELAEAERLYLASLQEVREQVGDLHLRTASARAPLVQLYREQNRGEDALEQALAIRAIHLDRLPPDHPDTAEGLNQLGAAYMAVGCGPEAIKALEEAVRIVRGLSPDPGRPLIELLLTLTSMQFDLGLVDEVSAVVAELAEIATPENGATLENRARVLETQGILASWRSDLEGALAFQSRANALRRSDPGTSRPDLANSLFNEGTLLRRMGRFEESLEPLQEAYRLELEIRGPEHPYAIQAAFDISIALRQLGRAEQALEPGRLAYEGFASALGPTHASTVSAARSLCEAHLQLGQVDAARPLLALYREHSTEPGQELQTRVLEARLALLEQRPAEALERLESVFERYRAEGRYAQPTGSAATVSELILRAYRALGDAEGEAAFEAELAGERTDAAPVR
jgi:tetratricopeptide (TPR) repeat protein